MSEVFRIEIVKNLYEKSLTGFSNLILHRKNYKHVHQINAIQLKDN